jgi:hypothetical protein
MCIIKKPHGLVWSEHGVGTFSVMTGIVPVLAWLRLLHFLGGSTGQPCEMGSHVCFQTPLLGFELRTLTFVHSTSTFL